MHGHQNRCQNDIDLYALFRHRFRWQYAYPPEAGSAEAALYSDFLKPRDFCVSLCCIGKQ